MTIEFSKVHEFTEIAKRASSISEVSEEFKAAVQELGFNAFSMADYTDFHNPPPNAIQIDGLPEHWVEHYLRERYAQCDPTFKIAGQYNMPFAWESPVVQTDLSDVQRQMYAEAREAGLTYGFSVPIPVVGSHPAVVSLCGDNTDIAPGALHATHLMAIYLYAATARISRQKNGPREEKRSLSRREQECLRWVSVGKTNWEIGCILSISENTVHYHIERAKRKLGATTRTQAVVQAFFENEISPGF